MIMASRFTANNVIHTNGPTTKRAKKSHMNDITIAVPAQTRRSGQVVTKSAKVCADPSLPRLIREATLTVEFEALTANPIKDKSMAAVGAQRPRIGLDGYW